MEKSPPAKEPPRATHSPWQCTPSIAITPLIKALNDSHPDTKQVWYADDATGAGSCSSLKKWWDHITTVGPKYGYFPKCSKSHLMVKPEFEESAKSIFEGTNTTSTPVEHAILVPQSDPKYSRKNLSLKRIRAGLRRYKHCQKLHHPSLMPFNQHSFMVSLVSGCLSPEQIDHLLQPLEDSIHQILIPGRPPSSKVEREIYALPSRLGGLGIPNPSSNSQSSFHTSVTLTTPHVNLITAQNLDGHVSREEICDARKNIRCSNRLRDICQANELDSVLSIDQKRQIALAKEKGASSWLTAMPIEEHGFFLNKGEFRDALHLHYGWDIRNTPQSCVCGSSFSINHAMTCKRDSFPIQKHTEIRRDSQASDRSLS